MRYRSTILIAILTVSLSSPTYTNGQTRPEPKVAIKAVGQKAAFLNGPPDLAVSLSSSQEVVFGSTPTDISQLARLSISISNQWSLTKSAPLVLTGSDVQNVHLRVELPQGTLFQVGNIGVDSGFACNTANNNVVCTGGKIAAGRRAYIYVDVAGTRAACSTLAKIGVKVEPAQNEVNHSNNAATTQMYVVNIC